MQKLRSNPNKLFKAAAAALILLAIAVSLTAYPLPAQAQSLHRRDPERPHREPRGTSSGSQLHSVTSYEVGVASTVTEATIAATANDSNADVDPSTPPDSNDATSGHQVALSPGKNDRNGNGYRRGHGTDHPGPTRSTSTGPSPPTTAGTPEHDLDGLRSQAGNNVAGCHMGQRHPPSGSVIMTGTELVYAYNRRRYPRPCDTTSRSTLTARRTTTKPVRRYGPTTSTVWIADDDNDGAIYAYNMTQHGS